MKTIVMLVAAICCPAFAVEIPVSSDATVSTLAADGKGPALQVGGGYRSYLLFNAQPEVAHVASSAIASAKLRLWVSKVIAPGSVDLFAAAGPWDENTITPGNAPAANPARLATFAVSVSGYITVDITSLVRSWRDAPSLEYGIVLAANSLTPGLNVQFESKESTLTSHSAVLDVSLSAPAGPAGYEGPPGDPGATGPMGNPGPAGGLVVSWETFSGTIMAGITSSVLMSCNTGTRPISGGCTAINDPTGILRLGNSSIWPPLNAWYCDVKNVGNIDKTIQLAVACGK